MKHNEINKHANERNHAEKNDCEDNGKRPENPGPRISFSDIQNGVIKAQG